MKFIYVFEDGSVAVSCTPPTATDLYCIGDGRLQVLKVSVNPDCPDRTQVSIKELDEDGEELTPNSATIHNEEGDDFHVVM